MKVGILGTGFGLNHARIYSYLEEVEVVKIFGRNEEKLKQIGKDFNIAVTTNIYDIINDPGIDIIDICLPTSQHAHYIMEALKAGKHVFCETPLCYSREDLVQIQEAEQKYHKRVFVDLFIKHSASYQYLYNTIQNNTYGKLKALTITRNTPAIWGPLGLDSIVTDLMLHDLDASVWYLGMPEKLSVNGISGREGEALVKATLQYKGASIYVEASSMMPKSYPFTVGYEAIFENGMLEYHETFTMEGNVLKFTEYASDGMKEINLEGHDPYEYAIRHVINCCKNGEETNLSAAAAANSLTLAFDLQDMLCNN